MTLTPPRHPRIRRLPLVSAAGYTLGALLLVVALTTFHGRYPSSPRRAALVLGAWLLIAAMVRAAPHRREIKRDLSLCVARLITESMFGSAIVFAAVILFLNDSKQSERLCYLLVALTVVPGSVALAWADSGEQPDRSRMRTLGTAAVIVVAALVARLSGSGHGSHDSLLLMLILVIGRGLVEVATRTPLRLLRPLSSESAYLAIPPLLAIAAVTFAPSGAVSVGRVAVAVLAGVVVTAVLRAGESRTSPRVRICIDVAVVVLASLAVFQLTVPDAVGLANQAYFLGPTNDVLHGQAVLVQTFSQYGIGIFYGLAGLFSVFPIGLGVMTLILSTFTALVFVTIYALVRMTVPSQLVAVLAVATAVIVYIFAGLWEYIDYPSTGVLRFGLPWVVVLLSVLAARTDRPNLARNLDRAVLVVVGLAAVWSGEDGLYCMATAVGIVLVECAMAEASLRTRAGAAVRRIAALVGAAVAALILFMVLTLLFSGSWPDWGPYLSYVHEYTTGGLGVLDIPAWSPGIAVGALYGASATAIVGLLVLRPDVVRAHAASFRATAGITVMGTVDYTYYLGRSAPTNLIHVAAPAVTLGFIWLGLITSNLGARRVFATSAIGAVAFLGALIATGDHVYFSAKFDDSALGQLVKDPAAAVRTFRTVADNPVVYLQSSELDGLIAGLHPGGRQLALLAYPPFETEALIRGGRANAVASSNPCQEEISTTGAARVLAEVRALKPGGLLITEATPPGPLLPFQEYALAEIAARFKLRQLSSLPVTTAYAYELIAQKATWHGGGSIPQPSPVTEVPNGCA